jgi:hypothetical protein
MLPAERDPSVSRTEFELRATGIKLNSANPMRSGIHTRGYLPHVKREGARYFVTFRLADSLPKEVLLKLRAERSNSLTRFHAEQASAKKLGKPSPPNHALNGIEREYRRKLERYLDLCSGACWLRRPEIADLVADALCHFEDERYSLSAWVVMPNHVHVVL